jgi:hypothetical protein
MNNKTVLEDIQINIKYKLAFLWTTLILLYIYADYFELMTPGKLEKMIALKTPVGPTSPQILISFSILLIVPALMVTLSIFLKPILSKWLNIIFSVFYGSISVLIIVSEFGSKWHEFYVLYNMVELIILITIFYQAWKWPKLVKDHSA